MDKFKRWLHSAAGKVSKALIIVSAVLICLIFSSYGENFLSIETANTINNILIGVATGLIVLVVTVSFVEYTFDKQDKEKERREEILKIKHYDKYMRTLIQRFIMFYISVTTRIEDRKSDRLDDPFNHKFNFSDLADMYLTSMYISEGFLEPSIVLFYRAEENLRAYMLRMLESIEFRYSEELEKILIEFVTKSADLDMRGNILGAIQTRSGKKEKLSECVSSMISDKNSDWLGKYARGELSGNLMLPYVIFYYNVQDQIRLLKKYLDYLKTLD